MTRYTRGTKSTTHQRGNPGNATPWTEFQAEATAANASAAAAKAKAQAEKVNATADDTASGGGPGPKLVKLFGQFWVPQTEAKRLQKLIVKLKGEGLSRKGISESLRNEIRRAEKKAKRSKDKTCFNCRQFGHLLADCPNQPAETIDSADNGLVGPVDGSEICFKCGSLEHTSRRCVKNKDNENFKFAKCFICKKTGHISRQCPENKHGIFPGGGACNECGESGHLAKDCPTAFNPADEEASSQAAKTRETGVTIAAVVDPKMSTEYEPVDEDWQKKVQQSLSKKTIVHSAPTHAMKGGPSTAKKRRVKF